MNHNEFQDELQQTVVVKLPETLSICREPPTDHSLKEMDKLLLLILGAAVQSSQKEEIIASIKNMPVPTQHAFVEKIREVKKYDRLLFTYFLKKRRSISLSLHRFHPVMTY
jgi:hypothetical protein